MPLPSGMAVVQPDPSVLGDGGVAVTSVAARQACLVLGNLGCLERRSLSNLAESGLGTNRAYRGNRRNGTPIPIRRTSSTPRVKVGRRARSRAKSSVPSTSVGARTVAPGPPPTTRRDDVGPRARAARASRREARGPEVELASVPAVGPATWRPRGARRSPDRRSRPPPGAAPRRRPRTRSREAPRPRPHGPPRDPRNTSSRPGHRAGRSRPGTGTDTASKAPRSRERHARPPLEACVRSASAASVPRASRRNSADWSTPTTSKPRRASARLWRPGPHPTSSTRIGGWRPNAATRKSTSCSGALRERLAGRPIRRPEERRDLVEPRLRGLLEQLAVRPLLGQLASPGRRRGARALLRRRPSWGRSRCRRRAGPGAR